MWQKYVLEIVFCLLCTHTRKDVIRPSHRLAFCIRITNFKTTLSVVVVY